MIIVNWGNKSKKLADMGFNKCGNCGNMELFELREVCKTIGVYFIPVAKWNKKRFLVCQSCGAGFEVEDKNIDEIMNESMSLPDNDTACAIWERLDQLVLHYINVKKERGEEYDLDKCIEYAKTILSQDGYKDDDVNYTIAKFLNDLSDKK